MTFIVILSRVAMMSGPYSLDLRQRVADFVAGGGSRRGAARHFSVSESFSIKLVRRVAETGSCVPGRQGRPRGSGKLDPHAAFLVAGVETRPDITMPELSARLAEEQGVKAAAAELSRFLCRRGFTYKKSSDGGGARTCRRA